MAPNRRGAWHAPANPRHAPDSPVELPRRRTVRLGEYDYTLNGVYFVTICTYGRACILGSVDNGVVSLTEIGRVVDEEWQRTPQVRREVDLDTYVVMPNHLHGILVIAADDARMRGDGGRMPWATAPTEDATGQTLRRRPRSLGSTIAGFKGAVTRRVNAIPDYAETPVWQRNYYEHVIRNDSDLERVREYIEGNPARWSRI